MNASTLRRHAWRRGAGALGLAVLAVALPACRSGSSQANRPSVSTEIVGPGGGNGPDNTGGMGGTSPITGQQFPNDVVLASDQVLLVIDGIGRDQTTAQFAPATVPGGPAGTPIGTVIGPSGGNIVDLELPGMPNDQIGVAGTAAQGILDLGNPANPADDVRSNPFNNLIANFEIIPDTSPDIVGAFGAIGANAGGLPTDLTSPAARRLVVRGVILDTNVAANCLTGPTAGPTFVGGQRRTVGQVFASNVSAEVPPRLFDNLVASAPIVCNSLGLPLIVTTVYTLHRSPSRFVSLSTTVVSPTTAAGGVAAPVFVTGIVQLFQTGGEGSSKNVDVLVPAPTFVTPGASLLPFPTGIAPYLTLVGRDEPGVSYTLWDTIVGQVVIQRIGNVAVAGAQVPRSDPVSRVAAPITPLGTVPGPLNWVRHIAVGERSDGDASTRHAIRELQRSPLRFIPGTNPALPLPNGLVTLAELGGQIEGGGAGAAVIQIFEISPAIFLNPLTSTLQASTSPILRTTVRTNPETGDWLALVPAGFSIPDVINPATGAVLVDNSSFRTGTTVYGIRVLLPGRAAIPPNPTDFASIVPVTRGSEVFDEGLYHARPIFVNEGAGASLSFIVQDENGLPLPAKLTVKGINSTPNPDLGLPTGLAAFSLNPTNGQIVTIDPGLTFERAQGSGNVLYSASGDGTVNLPIPPPLTSASYEIVASHGTEYEIEGTGATGVQQITVASGDVSSLVFTLPQVANNNPRRAISADFHVHASNSSDSGVPPPDRAISFVATGVDILTSTEHDSLFDFEPTIAGLGLQSRLVSLVGTEATAQIGADPFTQGIGHYNAFPLQLRSLERKNGAPEDEFRPAWVLFGQLRLQDGTLANEILQLNHPRSDVPAPGTPQLIGSGGFFEALSPGPASPTFGEIGGLLPTSSFFCAFNPDGSVPGGLPAGLRPSATSGPSGIPTSHNGGAGSIGARFINVLFNGGIFTTIGGPLTAAGVALGGPNQTQAPAGSLGFDTIEVMNGTQDGIDYLQTRGDWFNLISLGVVRVGTGNTDTHVLRNSPAAGSDTVGHPRTYLLVANPTVDAVRQDPTIVTTALRPPFENPQTMATNPGTGVVTVTGGAFRGQGGRTTLGKAFSTTGPFIDVAVFRRTLAGARDTSQTFTIGDFPSLVGFQDAVDVVLTVTAPLWVPVTEARLVLNGDTIIQTPVNRGGQTTVMVEFNNVSVTPTMGTADSFIVVETGQTLATILSNTLPGGRFNDVAPGAFSVAFANPVFIDRDGDGVFDPPGSGRAD